MLLIFFHYDIYCSDIFKIIVLAHEGYAFSKSVHVAYMLCEVTSPIMGHA